MDTRDALRPYLTDAQVADWLVVPTRRVRQWAKAGQIPCVTLPDGSYVFDSVELGRWAVSLKTGGAASRALAPAGGEGGRR